MQQGQVFELKKRAVDGRAVWRTGIGPTVGFATFAAGRLLLQA
jgi:hypothetical protein